MPKPILAVFIGDTHIGSDTGLCLPNFPIGSKDGRPYQPSANQQWLYDRWQELIESVKVRAVGYRLFVGLGGDLVDGVQHHGTTQTSGVYSDQVSMAIDLLAPLISAADIALGVTGTAAHVGDMGDNDRSIYYHFKIDVVDKWARIGDKEIIWQHHGVGVGMLEHTRENAMISHIKDVGAWCLAQGYQPPAAIIVHDKHRSFKPILIRGMWGAVCPCWQFPTNYGSRFIGAVNIGALVWDLQSNYMTKVEPQRERRFVTAG